MTARTGVMVRLRRRRSGSESGPVGVCNAPFASMYLDQHCSVRARLPEHRAPTGNVANARLRNIWEGEQARALRDAMLRKDLDHGCAFGKWQVSEGNDRLVFDHLRPESTTSV